MKPRGELALIDQIRRQFSAQPTTKIALGIGDDCAILRPLAGHEVLVTTDFTLEDRHFRRDLHPAHVVGSRCLTRGLSDLAAMGATPLAAFLSIALPANLPARWISQFLNGLHATAKAANVTLAGGDTAQSPDKILADIILLGTAPNGTSLRRSGASPGDTLYVTGTLGGAAAQLRTLLAGGKIRTHLLPTARLQVGYALRAKALATACIDLSDGLSTDLAHLCDASNAHAEVDLNRLPMRPGASLDDALNGGEDYELLFTARPDTRIPRSIARVPITPIGRILRRSPRTPQVTQIAPDESRSPLPRAGWEHFKSRSH